MTLDEIKNIARLHPEQISINWAKIEKDPEYRKDFEDVVNKALMLLPGIEIIHAKLTAGESVTFEGESTSLNHKQVEEYTELVEEELFCAYQLQEMWNRYQAVMNLVNSI